MITRRARERFCVAVVLCAAACACAVQTAETVGTGKACLAPASAQGASAFDSAVGDASVFSSTSEARFADIGRQVLDPARYSHPLSDSANTHARTLPAVPAAIVMTLFGFLCVSITRDRRAWLALAGGLIWLGQAGVETVPQLAQRIRARSIRQSTVNRLSFCHTMAEQPAGCDEQIIYVGLLHKLAGIPDHAFATNSSDGAKAGRHARPTDGRCPAPAMARLDAWANIVNECPASATGHIMVFSPAFIFANLSRGPPAVARESDLHDVC